MSSKRGKYHKFSYYTWQRLKKNKLALFGLGVIGLMTLISVLGYIITPDDTPDADDQILEFSRKPPGFSEKVLLVKENKEYEKGNFFTHMLFGKERIYKAIPFKKYTFEEDYIVLEQFTDLPDQVGAEIRVNVADVVYAINYYDTVFISKNKSTIAFYEFENDKKIVKTVPELRKTIEEEFITTRSFLLGTDRNGRDMLSRLMIGTRVSLAVGLISVFISVIIGVLLGSISGFFRGWVDDVVMWVINVVWSIPTLLLVIAMTFVLGKGFWQIFVAVGLTMWVEVARVIRGQIISLREKEFVEAGKALGFSNLRIIWKHVLPNVMGPVIVISANNFASAILIEAGLSFLGIGVQPPMSSWGAMISAHMGYITTNYAYLAFLPGLAIMLMVLAFMLLGNGLRDALDTKSVEDEKVMGY